RAGGRGLVPPEMRDDRRALRIAQALFAERFEQGVFCIRVIHDGYLGGQVVGQIEELFAGGDGHEDFLRAFVSSQFDDADGIINGLDGSPEIESADDNESTFQAALDERGTHGEQDGYSSRRRTFGRIKGAEVDG